ncbi:D-aminoacylase [Albimonas sp. CAU 1670]|uniref:N-acyl-D-amino-acid deacylase family protein n=1 Tax=Albimonas sp. CAU 1670 TaxID=3032599 RepID=UPI0023DA0DE7|nr:D-aminoacylase [Albimonas sp. CAU 1670]MDF2233382.1 D-aminoacylase [Albimonas sp. CAU 1670]
MSLLIRNALVYDGSGAAPMKADVAVEGGAIVGVGPDLPVRADEVRDAGGLALAPGFIDVHTHDDAVALEADGLHPKLSQGVTTVVTGNCGISLAPSPMAGREAPPPPLDLIGEAAAYRFPRFVDFLDALRAFTPGCNVVPLVGHHVLRARAMADLARPAADHEIEAMRADLAEALAAGAAGLSTGLAYPPARHATTDEIAALAADVAAAGRIWTTHMRDERLGVVSSVAETLDVARRSGVRTLISHHKCCGEAAFGLSATTLAMIETARKTMPIDLDLYPYTASSTVLIETFARDSRKVTVSWSDPHPEMAGRDLAEICAEWGVDQNEAIGRLRPGGAIYHQMDDGDLERILAYPPTLVGSDGLPRDKRPHPRLWGAFPRVLGHYARDKGVISLQTAIAKMTGQTAKTLHLADRGRIAPGCKADLVLFDPAAIHDAADYDHPVRPAEGIAGVWVNGVLAWAEGAPTDAPRAGQVLAA